MAKKRIMSRERVKQRIVELLDDLGESAEVVRAKLVEQKCRGILGSNLKCPVAEYLKKHNILSPSVGSFAARASADWLTAKFPCQRPCVISSIVLMTRTFQSWSWRFDCMTPRRSRQ